MKSLEIFKKCGVSDRTQSNKEENEALSTGTHSRAQKEKNKVNPFENNETKLQTKGFK